MNIIKIYDLDNPLLEPYKTLRRTDEHRKEGIFIAEGEKVVRRLIDSDLKIRSLLLTQGWSEKLFGHVESPDDNLLNRHPIRLKDSTVFIGEKDQMKGIVGYRLHQGVMAVAEVPEEPALEDLFERIPSETIAVALDGLVNSENVGVIVRNCAAFGVEFILSGETASSPYLRRSVRNSMGAVFQIPVVHTENLRSTLGILRNRFDMRVIATDPRQGGIISETDLGGNICVVFGNEHSGISQNILDICDVKVSIPMMKNTDSLNVASASAVFLYEARKRRGYI